MSLEFSSLPFSLRALLFVFLFLSSVVLFVLPGTAYSNFVLIIACLLFASSNMFRLYLLLHGISLSKNSKKHCFNHSDLPTYTVLIPMFHEANMIKQIIINLQKLNYPKEKLDVKIVIEEDDEDIRLALGKIDHDFQIIIVPFSLPRTKPKACNYALGFAKGEFVTIYDAEDNPDPDQLKKAVSLFRSYPHISCIQAKLNYYNYEQNFITRCFAIEYSMTFDVMLKALEGLSFPIPLGGTSNHFRLKTLRSLGSWDPFNVTEDAEIGIRMYKKGLKCIIMDSYTLEESPAQLMPWLKQRTRWMKGFIQTYLLHIGDCIFSENHYIVKLKSIMVLQLFILNPIISYLLAPIILIALYEAAQWFTWVSIANLIIWIISNITVGIFAVKTHKWAKMLTSIVLFNPYFVLHTIASYRAMLDIILRPVYWDKTPHGHSICTDQNLDQ